MILDLREIVGVPGQRAVFDYEPDLARAVFDPITAILPHARAVGEVRNGAGAMSFTATLDVSFTFICSRCAGEFTRDMHREVTLHLTDDEETGDDPDMYWLESDFLDVDELLVTVLILDAEQRMLCREDCSGLCVRCGSDLNDGDCGCPSETDPRLAELERFLEEL
ncbi:MAG: DUF177 domain-containing protein [Oscillospiraceae bacterium]|jgi:uncharacterized protein|nr:DUF177 domain-containing protein [Oscillospiraceae bacterium]